MNTPLACQTCPLCGGPNACKPAQTGQFGGEPCWCTTVTFDAQVLAQVPTALRGQACICQACATQGQSEKQNN